MAELRWQSALSLIDLMKSGRLSSRELVSDSISQIERQDPIVNAVVIRDFERATEKATAADEARSRGDTLGPLHGLPMTVKEAFQVAGLPTTWGLRDPAKSVTQSSAEAVKSLEAAGAIILGKTNVPTVLGDCQTFNATYGLTRNPWDVARTAGGSSGGAAAALAAGFVPLELGSDLAGSIRTPAHFCGVFGHRSSYGAISAAGHAMPGVLAPADISVPGPMARTADDLRLAFHVLSAPPHQRQAKTAFQPPSQLRLPGLKIAVLRTHQLCEVSNDTLDCIDKTIATLRRCGVTVDENPTLPIDVLTSHRDFMLAFRSVGIGAMPAPMIQALIEEAGRLDPDDWSYKATAARTAALRHVEWLALDQRRHQSLAAWSNFFRQYDAFICPAHPRTAFPHITDVPREQRRIEVNGHSQDYNDYLFWAGLPALCYLPSTTVPIGLAADGLPVGVQLIGDFMADQRTIEIAGLLAPEMDEIVYPKL